MNFLTTFSVIDLIYESVKSAIILIAITSEKKDNSKTLNICMYK